MKKKILILLLVILFIISLLIGLLWPRSKNTAPSGLENKTIENAVKQTDVEYKDYNFNTVSTKQYGDWMIATIELTTPENDLANVVFKKVDDKWVVVDGPGTDFEEDFLRQQGAPEEIIQEANVITGPSTALEP